MTPEAVEPNGASRALGVRDSRKAQGLTQAQLAEAIGVSRQTIISIERGDYAPSVYLALRLAAHLKSTVEALFPFEGDAR